MGLRQAVFDALKTDVQLNSLGITEDSLYPAAVDSPQQKLFAVLAWGTSTLGPGRDSTVNLEDLTLWVYNRERNYGPITDILKRSRVIVLGLERVWLNPGWTSGVNWLGSSVDLWDDAYLAATRNDAYRIAASG
jgi:hypothetical protein